jgi:hypothetical protein
MECCTEASCCSVNSNFNDVTISMQPHSYNKIIVSKVYSTAHSTNATDPQHLCTTKNHGVVIQKIVIYYFFFLVERPNLFAMSNNTFSKWWEG